MVELEHEWTIKLSEAATLLGITDGGTIIALVDAGHLATQRQADGSYRTSTAAINDYRAISCQYQKERERSLMWSAQAERDRASDKAREQMAREGAIVRRTAWREAKRFVGRILRSWCEEHPEDSERIAPFFPSAVPKSPGAPLFPELAEDTTPLLCCKNRMSRSPGELPPYPYHALRRGGILTIGAAAGSSEEELLAVRNFGMKALEDLRQVLAYYAALNNVAEITPPRL